MGISMLREEETRLMKERGISIGSRNNTDALGKRGVSLSSSDFKVTKGSVSSKKLRVLNYENS